MFLKKRKPLAISMNYFVRDLRNEIALASTKKSKRFYVSVIGDVLLIFVQMAES